MRPTPRCSAAAASTAPSTAPAAPRSWPSAARSAAASPATPSSRAAGGCRPASSSTPSVRCTATAGRGSRSCSRAPTAGASRSRSSTASGRSRSRPSRPAPIASRSPRPPPSPSARWSASSWHGRGRSRWCASSSSATRTWPPTRRRSRRRLATPGAAWHRGEGRSRVSAAERERTAMRKVLMALLLLGVVLGRPAVLRAESPAAEFGLAVGAAAGNLVYLPVKVIVAFGGLALGSLTGVLTGGDVRAAYAVWVPAASGTYLLTPAHLEGTVPIEFFGSDYADQSSRAAGAAEGAGIYDIQYQYSR